MTRSREPRLPTLTRVLIGPPGRWLIPVTALAGLLLMDAVSVPGGYFMTMILSVFTFLGVAVVWAPRLIVGLFRSDGRPGLRRHWLRWASVPLIGALTLGLVWPGVPYTARFALSESSMEHLAREIMAGREGESGGRWVGLFSMSSIQRADGAVLFSVRDTGFLDQYGFAWSPDGGPWLENGEYTHIKGAWYEWRESY